VCNFTFLVAPQGWRRATGCAITGVVPSSEAKSHSSIEIAAMDQTVNDDTASTALR